MSTELTVMICGDSISGCSGQWPYHAFNITSVGDCGDPLIQRTCTYYSGLMLLRNMAISGTRLASGSNNVGVIRPTYVDPIYARKSFSRSGATARKYLYINAIGSNDGAIDGYATPALYAAAVAADIVAAKNAGADYGWICALLPRGDGVMTEPNRLTYNPLAASPSWRLANGVDDYLDLPSAPHAGPANLPINNGGDTTWYMDDNVHPQDVLSAEIGAIARAKLLSFVAGLQ